MIARQDLAKRRACSLRAMASHLSHLLGEQVAPTTLARLERGESRPSPALFEHVVAAYKLARADALAHFGMVDADVACPHCGRSGVMPVPSGGGSR